MIRTGEVIDYNGGKAKITHVFNTPGRGPEVCLRVFGRAGEPDELLHGIELIPADHGL